MINAHIQYIYADKGGSKFIFSDNGKKISSASMVNIVDQLGFTKVTTSPYSPHSNSGIERCLNFLQNSIRKLRSNHETDWDHLAPIAVMVYNIFPHTAAGESQFFLMYIQDSYLPNFAECVTTKDTLHKWWWWQDPPGCNERGIHVSGTEFENV